VLLEVKSSLVLKDRDMNLCRRRWGGKLIYELGCHRVCTRSFANFRCNGQELTFPSYTTEAEHLILFAALFAELASPRVICRQSHLRDETTCLPIIII